MPSAPAPKTVPKPTPSPRPATPAPQPTPSAGNFTSHSADELKVGSKIVHSRFGRGEVVRIDTSGSDAKIDVVFNDGQTRKLLLKFAKFEIL